MSGITTGVGLFSGINTADLISQLLAVDGRPKVLAQRRIAQLQQTSAAYLDLNSRLSALQTSIASFRTDKIFQSKSVSTSNPDALSATADATAAAGSYPLLVDRLVSTQQRLSRGFVTSNSTAVGASSITFESARARLDRDIALADLNGGAGIARGKINITDSANRAATIDLSRAVTVNDVLEAINANGTAQVTASVEGGRFVIRDNANGSLTIANGLNSTTAASLGIAGTATGTITGSEVYSLSANTALTQINDGNGVRIRNTVGVGTGSVYDFKINLNDGGSTTSVLINLGDVYETIDDVLTKTEGQVSTIGGVVDRINEALQAAAVENGFGDQVVASINATTGGIDITDSSGTLTLSFEDYVGQNTTQDLGLVSPTAPSTTVSGRRILAGLNSTLTRNLGGGTGVGGDGTLNITARDGFAFSVNLDNEGSVSDVIAAIQDASGGRLSVALDSNGTGLTINDLTGSTASNLIIEGTPGDDTAVSLGISTGAAGVAADTLNSSNLQHQYVTRSSSLLFTPTGQAIGTGAIRITDSQGANAEFTIDNATSTYGQLIDKINAANLTVSARINARGDGLELFENVAPGAEGSVKIKVEDVTGTVARRLNILGEASGTNADNHIDGSFEQTVTLSAADNLETVAQKINTANPGVRAAVIRDGSSSAPFRLSLASTQEGRAGRMIISSDFDFGFQTLDEGEDARVFFGASDPARGIAVTSSSNRIDSLLPGVKIDLRAPTAQAETVNVVSDSNAVREGVQSFVNAFNDVVSRISELTKYDQETEQKGALLGDGTTLNLRNDLYRTVQSAIVGASGTFRRLEDIGIRIGSGGKLEINQDRFDAAMAQDAQGVESLFTARELASDQTIDIAPGITARNPNFGSTLTTQGVAVQLEELAKKYVDSTSGTLTLRVQGVDAQIKIQNDQIARIDAKLVTRRQVLEAKFLAMEKTLGQLRNQQSALGSLGG